MIALANLVAVFVDTMHDANVPNDVTQSFLDKLDLLNELTLSGAVEGVLYDVIDIVRSTVPDNDRAIESWGSSRDTPPAQPAGLCVLGVQAAEFKRKAARRRC